jgi:hypothetical protein
MIQMADKPPQCMCGCGKRTGGGTFLPGHDAKLRGKLVRGEIKGTKEQWAFFKSHGWKVPKK